MIIKDSTGDDHELSDTRLSETIGHASGYPYHLKLTDLKAAVKEKAGVVLVHGHCGLGRQNSTTVTFEPKKRRIGCRVFSPEVYAKILKAAGVKKARKKKAAK